MIINKITKGWQTRSDMPSGNWAGEGYYAVDDNSTIARKVQELYPRYDFVLSEEGKLVDVTKISKTQEELNEERKDEIKAELENFDRTINRATEDLYTLANVTPYEKVADVIQKKKELRTELQSLESG